MLSVVLAGISSVYPPPIPITTVLWYRLHITAPGREKKIKVGMRVGTARPPRCPLDDLHRPNNKRNTEMMPSRGPQRA